MRPGGMLAVVFKNVLRLAVAGACAHIIDHRTDDITQYGPEKTAAEKKKTKDGTYEFEQGIRKSAKIRVLRDGPLFYPWALSGVKKNTYRRTHLPSSIIYYISVPNPKR